MRRDLDLIRKILLAIETNTGRKIRDNYVSAFPGIEPLSSAVGEPDIGVIALHMALIVDCGYVEVIPFARSCFLYSDYKIIRLTSDGCDYLDSVRDDDIWNATKEKIKSVGGSATLEVIKSLAEKVMSSQLGI